jgi:hypothetical protein
MTCGQPLASIAWNAARKIRSRSPRLPPIAPPLPDRANPLPEPQGFQPIPRDRFKPHLERFAPLRSRFEPGTPALSRRPRVSTHPGRQVSVEGAAGRDLLFLPCSRTAGTRNEAARPRSAEAPRWAAYLLQSLAKDESSGLKAMAMIRHSRSSRYAPVKSALTAAMRPGCPGVQAIPGRGRGATMRANCWSRIGVDIGRCGEETRRSVALERTVVFGSRQRGFGAALS